MIGNWKWNVYVATVAMGITFLTSLANNEWSTSFYRSLYGFIIVFVSVYVVRFLFGTIAGINQFSNGTLSEPNSDSIRETGQSIDLETPDDENLLQELLKNQTLNEQAGDTFIPLQPQKLVSTEKVDPELLVGALRQMSEE